MAANTERIVPVTANHETMIRIRHLSILMSFFCLVSRAATAQSFRTDVAPLVKSSCLHCHDAATDTGLNLEAVEYNISTAETFRLWEAVFDRVHSGEMPPNSKDRPNPAHLQKALNSLKKNLQTVSLAKQQRIGRVPSRRLTKTELGYALRDLLSVGGNTATGIPDEAESGRFDTIGSTQRISAVHMESYLKAADEALDLALRLGKNPYRHVEFDILNDPYINAFHELPLTMGGNVTRKLDDGVALFIDADYLTRATNFGFFVKVPGVYRIRSTVAAFQSDESVTCKLVLRKPGGEAKLLKASDLEPGATKTFEVSVFLRPGDDFYLTFDSGRTIAQDFKTLHAAGGAGNYTGPGIAIKAQEVEGPVFDTWPPASTQRLLHGIKLISDDDSGAGKFSVELSEKPIQHLASAIRYLAPRIFRRPPVESELQAFVSLAEPAIRQDRDFVDVLRIPLRAMLSSPQFLILSGEPGRLDDYALASRLSFFLWKSLPDEQLYALAKEGQLSDAKVLAQQTDRMLDDEKSNRFVRDFPGQWLRLHKVNDTTPDRKLYPEYDEVLGDAIPKEPELFFAELVRKNLSVTNLIDSDFTFVNSRLAAHYGILGVHGQHFRRVKLPDDSPRGGVLTQAAVLKTTANGTVTSPVVRGNFVLTNFLGTPPSPPPPAVGSIEPDTQGKTTIREILAAHRNTKTCNNCHREIDPPGFALECFDPIGGFRTNYRANAKGKGAKSWEDGPPVDTSGVTADGVAFQGIEEFRQHLIERKEQVVANFISQLVVYSTGGEIQFADRDEIDAIVARTRPDGFLMRNIIHEVVQSRLFRNM